METTALSLHNVKIFSVSKVLEYLYSDIVFIQIIKFLYTMWQEVWMCRTQVRLCFSVAQHTLWLQHEAALTESARERLNVLRNILRRWILQFFKIYLCFPAEFQQQDGSKEWGFSTITLSLIVTFIIINFGVFFLSFNSSTLERCMLMARRNWFRLSCY